MNKLWLAMCLVTLIPVSAVADWGPPLDLPNAPGAADPCVIEVDDVYYLYVTASGVNIECWTSTDLLEWDYAGIVWEQKPAGAWNDNNLWAPEVHRDGEDFYLYYAANHKIGVAAGDSPLGPFVDVYDHPFVGAGYGGVNGEAIDAHVFRDDDGRPYFYFAGYRPLSTIVGVEMIDMTTLAPGPSKSLVWTGLFNWELFVVEGPWMVKRDGVYYLMYSGGGANLPVYAVGYATAASPLGDFREYGGNPILHRDDASGIYGPGHHSTTEAPDGQLKIVYHTKKEVEVGWDREIRINDLCFTESGRMYVGLDGCTEHDEPADDDDDDDDNDDTSPPAPAPADDDDNDDHGCG
jgi:beta-xylosidase